MVTDKMHSDLAVVKSQVMQMHEEIKRLTHILIEDPRNSLLSRISVNETKLVHHDSMLIDIMDSAWQLKLALITSLLGFIGSIGLICFDIFLKGKP